MKTNKPYKYNSSQAKQSDQEFEELLKRNKYAKLKAQWDKKLHKSGFEDQENKHGALKQPETRTIAWANRDVIRDFFLRLDEYLTKSKKLNPLHRQILELYSQGKYIDEICESVNRGRTTVKNIIRYYKVRLVSGYWNAKDYNEIYNEKIRLFKKV